MYISSVLNSSRLLAHIRHSLWNREWNDSYKWWLFWTSPRGDICLFFSSFLFFCDSFLFFTFSSFFQVWIVCDVNFRFNAFHKKCNFSARTCFFVIFIRFILVVYCWLHIHSLGAKPARVSGTISTIRDREKRNYVHWEKVSRRKE